METQLEDLPNELLWFIMEYIPLFDLFSTFFNLNQRLNTIISSINYQLNFSYINQKEYQYLFQEILPNIDKNLVQSITFDDIQNRLSSINIFRNLRSLTIFHLRTETLHLLANSLLLNFQQLNFLCLYSEFILNEIDVNELTRVIFSDKISSLKYCYLAFQDFSLIRFDHLNKKKKNSTLKTLILDQWCRLRDFIQLLHFIPNIRRLTVRLYDTNSKDTKISSLNTIDDFTSLIPNLIYFRVKLSQISFPMASTILFNCLPSQLHELSLSTWSIDYANGESWEAVLSSKFSSLKHFRLIISLDRIPSDYSFITPVDLDNFLKSFNQSKYFQDHHWTFLLNINERDRLKFVLHTHPYSIENFQTTLYNIHRSTLPSIIPMTYKNVSKLTLTLHDDVNIDHHDQRYFPNLEQLVFLSNLSNETQQFPTQIYFNHLKNLLNLSTITSLNFLEETRLYPITLINLLLKNLPQLKLLTLSYQLYVYLHPEYFQSLKTLTLIFTIYSSISPPATRMRQLLTSNQILTNDLILKLVRTCSFLQTLTLLVRHFDGFDQQFSAWLKTNFSNENYDLITIDKLVRFYF